jgi:hypothetical protein|tara:strand:- start:413 stop:877 length:465 start_codon:yes stop_codon:yes gene_type:complete
MLVDPITAFAATKSAIGLIQQGIKVGKDLTDLASPIMKWAEAESHIDTHSSNKGKSVFGKFSSIEQNAIAAHLRKMEIEKMRNQLREIFLLYAPDGLVQWEALQKEIARQRKEHKDAIKRRIEARRRKLHTIMWFGAVIVISVILGAEFYFILN